MQIIGPFYTRKSYTKEAVDLFIDQYGYKVKNYGTYLRKNFVTINIYRYYKKLQTKKKTFSILPAFLFSKKQKSLSYFFQLMRIYCHKQCSLEQLWSYNELDDVFPCFRTLQSYHSKLLNQVHQILKILAQQCTILDSSIVLPDLLPDEQTIHNRLNLLFNILDLLIEIIHRKNIHSIILQEESIIFLHAFLFQKADLVFLDSS